jgi:hypothetical protein
MTYNTGPKGERIRAEPGDFLCMTTNDGGGYHFVKVAVVSEDGWTVRYLDSNEAAWQIGDVKTWAIPARILEAPAVFWDAVKARQGMPFASLPEATEWARPFLWSYERTRRKLDGFLSLASTATDAELSDMVRALDDATVLALWGEMCKGVVFGHGVRLRNMAWDVMAERTKTRAEQPPAPKGRRVQGVRRTQ